MTNLKTSSNLTPQFLSANNPRPATQDWVRFRSIAYLTGRGLAFGVGDDIFPRVAIAPGKFSLNTDLLPNPNVSVCDGRLDIFQDQIFDHVVIGPSLTMVPSPAGMVRELTSKLRMGGHVVIYLRKNQQPNQYTKFAFDEGAMVELLMASGAWRIKYRDTRGDDMLLVAKKVAGSRGTIYLERERAAKRACIVRYGALGDMILLTPLIKKLHEDGYEVTMNITPYAAPLLENNPYVDNIVLQEREAIPNLHLGPYWEEWKKDYDLYLNFSESIEGKLLKVEGRPQFYTTKEWRTQTCGGTNYQDWTMYLGGYPELVGARGEIFFSSEERKEAKKLRESLGGKFVVGWALHGSSHHKMYPLAQLVLESWLAKHPDVVVYLLGGDESRGLEWDHPQVVKTSGQWPIRRSLAFLGLVCDLVVGPESVAVNAASCWDTPKITFLSHSVHDNLCRYWTNDYCLAPDVAAAPCYPCHQLHYTAESCPTAEMRDKTTGEALARGPVCAMGAISGERVEARLEEVYQKFGRPAARPTLEKAVSVV